MINLIMLLLFTATTAFMDYETLKDHWIESHTSRWLLRALIVAIISFVGVRQFTRLKKENKEYKDQNIKH